MHRGVNHGAEILHIVRITGRAAAREGDDPESKKDEDDEGERDEESEDESSVGRFARRIASVPRAFRHCWKLQLEEILDYAENSKTLGSDWITVESVSRTKNNGDLEIGSQKSTDSLSKGE